MAMMVGTTIASMMATESIRMVFSAAATGPCGSRIFIGAPLPARSDDITPKPRYHSELGVPADPVAETAAHHVFEIAALQPGQFLGEEGYALTIAAGHAGDVGAPEHTLRTKGVENTMQAVLDIAERIALRRIMRRAGRLDRDIGQFCQRQQLIQTYEGLGVLAVPVEAAMVDQQPQIRNFPRNNPPIIATGRPSLAAIGHSQSYSPANSRFCCASLMKGQRNPSMPGWLRQPCNKFWFSCMSSGNCPSTASRSGYFRAASIATAFASGSQLKGGWISAASTPASSISFSNSSARNFSTLRCAPLGGITTFDQM